MANLKPAGVFDTSYAQDLRIDRSRRDRLWKNLAFVALLLLPMLSQSSPLGWAWLGDQYVSLVARVAIFVIAVQGLNLLVGYTGQVSLGHGAFMAVGAYGSAILARELGFSFWLALPTSALLTGVVGLVFGLPSLRVKGFYLAMATLAAQFIIPWVLRYPMEDLTGGTRPLSVPAPIIGPFAAYAEDLFSEDAPLTFAAGDPYFVDVIAVRLPDYTGEAPRIDIINPSGDVVPYGDVNLSLHLDDDGKISGLDYIASKPGNYGLRLVAQDGADGWQAVLQRKKALSFASDIAMYYLIVPLSALLMFLARNIIRTRTGRAFISVRDNDLAAELLGINVFATKLRAFFLSSVYAGVAGCLLAFERNSLSLQMFELDVSIEMLAMLIIGGAGFPLGALFGVTFIRLLQEAFIPMLRPLLSDWLPQLFPFIDVVNITSAINPLLFGGALMLFLVLEPRGIAHRWEILKAAWKLRPYAY
ncbi:MAG: branched-chain amino acid ABC transporter permease [Chloroflexi bacterium]|nr:branched-chain amino acid ABC transporter permease [Chloroflexota bacterium]MCY3583644.1 branched-chain amino acid ABC transporter permease [Chloroflexota bacterium]MCY3715526.1 branched-chain amino acid ABC transporter permease [Chloroflexota bacterium]MDE2650259.1 branched-chain amino acid ABC transporter permease [Chloroflexota bacterium]MXV93159.1 branched-chain amino acid ABC transporter permease [Chloroflexota bacterium]